jgi:transposase
VWNILERKPTKLDLVLLNPQHVKALPGHKTDRVDAARIAELTQYGLVRASFVPPEEIRELRDLVRRRVHLARIAAAFPAVFTGCWNCRISRFPVF